MLAKRRIWIGAGVAAAVAGILVGCCYSVAGHECGEAGEYTGASAQVRADESGEHGESGELGESAAGGESGERGESAAHEAGEAADSQQRPQ